MSWRVMDPRGCVDMRAIGQSPMNRWTIIGSTVVFIRVYESTGVIDLMDLQDF